MKKNIVRKLLFVFMLLSVLFCKAQSTFEIAEKEYLYGDLNKSVELLTISISQKDEVAKSYMYRGAAKTFLKRFSSALIDMDSSYFLDSTSKKIYFYYGKFYLISGNANKALKYYDTAIFRNPAFASAYDERAQAKVLLKDFGGAIQDEDVAIKLMPNEQDFYNVRGYAKSELQQYKESIEDFSISLQLQPNHKAYVNRGFAYAKLGLDADAISDYSNALEFFPEDYVVYFYRGLLFKKMGKQKDACSDFRKSKDLGYDAADIEMKKNCN